MTSAPHAQFASEVVPDRIVADFNAALDRWFDAYDACLASLIAQRERQRAELDAMLLAREQSK